VSYRLREHLIARLGEAPDRAARVGVALTALTEIAALLADELRARAQAQLAALQPTEQTAALTADTPAVAASDGPRIAAAVEALMRAASPEP
jgi:hypothetical protein